MELGNGASRYFLSPSLRALRGTGVSPLDSATTTRGIFDPLLLTLILDSRVTSLVTLHSSLTSTGSRSVHICVIDINHSVTGAHRRNWHALHATRYYIGYCPDGLYLTRSAVFFFILAFRSRQHECRRPLPSCYSPQSLLQYQYPRPFPGYQT